MFKQIVKLLICTGLLLGSLSLGCDALVLDLLFSQPSYECLADSDCVVQNTSRDPERDVPDAVLPFYFRGCPTYECVNSDWKPNWHTPLLSSLAYAMSCDVFYQYNMVCSCESKRCISRQRDNGAKKRKDNK